MRKSAVQEKLEAQCPELKRLDLSGNQISSLPAGRFTEIPILDQLNLSGNRLTAIPAGLFASVPGLRRLDLSGNQMSSLANGAFSGATELTHLDLSGNPGSPLPVTISIVRIRSKELKFLVPTGAPRNIPNRCNRRADIGGNCP